MAKKQTPTVRKPRKVSRITTAVKEQVSQQLPVVVEKTTMMELNNPAHIVGFSKTLKKFIEEQKLSTLIQGKSYVLVDGWKFAGVNFGLTPIAKRPVNETKGDEIKYSCECEIVNMATGKVVGYGFAICSNKETAKKRFDEYAVVSMAQTRAIAKAYRNLLGYVMNAAGYETTPAEEAEEIPKYNAANGSQQEEQDVPEDMQREMLLITELPRFVDWVNDQTDWHKNTKFQALCKQRKQELIPVKK